MSLAMPATCSRRSGGGSTPPSGEQMSMTTILERARDIVQREATGSEF